MINNEIIVWHEMDGIGDSSLKYIETICNELEEKENIKFKFVKMNIKEFIDRLNNLYQEVEKPDVIFIAQDMVSIEHANLSEVPQKYSKYMNISIWNSMKYKGIQKGIPYLQGNHAVMFYNKKYFDNAPRTWDDIKNCKTNHACSISVDLKTAYWLMPFIYTLYGNPISDGKVTITIKNTLEVQKFITDLIKDKVLVSYSAISSMLEKFTEEKIACIMNGEWLYEYLYETMGNKLGICLLPKIKGIEMKGISSSVGIAFPANSLNGPKKENLELFINYMLNEKVQKKWLTEHKRIPVNKNVLVNMEKTIIDKNMLSVYEQMKKNSFLVNDECMNELWEQADKILNEIT